MSKIERKHQKVFGSSAGANDIGVFGSLAASNPQASTDPDEIQSLPNYEQGWKGAIIGNNSPAIEDVNALDYLFSRQLAYLFQEGVPEWNSETEYHAGSFAKGNGTLYVSLANDNVGNPLSDVSKWMDLSSQPEKNLTVLRNICTRNFTQIDHPSSFGARDVTYSEELDRFIAVGNQQKTIASFDGGKTWVEGNNPGSGSDLHSIAWSPSLGLFVATGSNTIITSPNGAPGWDTRTSPADYNWARVIWVPEKSKFFAVGVNNLAEDKLCFISSEDGVTWDVVSQTDDYGEFITFTDAGFVYSPERDLFVVSGSGGILVSSDLENFTQHTFTDEYYFTADWAPELGKFIVGGSKIPSTSPGDAVVRMSSDGVTWTAHNPNAIIMWQVKWSSELRMFLGGFESSILMTSADGENWKFVYFEDTTPTTYRGMVWSKGRSRFIVTDPFEDLIIASN